MGLLEVGGEAWTLGSTKIAGDDGAGGNRTAADIATGNTFKDLLENGSMTNGLKYVLFINVCIAVVGLIMFWLINRKLTTFTPEEMDLLHQYPSPQEREEPGRMNVVAPPPLLWRGVRDFLFSEDSSLSEDAQLYLLFQRICVALTFVLGFVSCTILIPTYFFGGGYARSNGSNSLSSTTSFFTATTAHNIPSNSLLLYLQIPVWIVVCIGITYLFVNIHMIAGKERYEWHSGVEFEDKWAVFLRDLPADLDGAEELDSFLNTEYPNSVDYVELVYHGKFSETKRQRNLIRLRSRIDYFERNITRSPSTQALVSKPGTGRVSSASKFSVAYWLRSRSLKQQIRELEARVTDLMISEHEENTFLRCGFTSFNDERTALQCVRKYRERKLSGIFRLFKFLKQSWSANYGSSGQERFEHMVAEFAPKPNDVIWSNVGIGWWQRTATQVGIQLFVFLLLMSFTSPVAILWGVKQMFSDSASVFLDPFLGGFGSFRNDTSPDQFWSDLGSLFNNASSSLVIDESNSMTVNELFAEFLPSFVQNSPQMRTFLLSYAPTLFLAVINALVPSVLRALSILEKYRLRSELELSVLRKTIFYFVMNLIILPAFAMNTASQVVKYILKALSGEPGKDVTWLRALPLSERLYTSDIAFFLCNYLVQLAFTGNIQSLLIPSHLLTLSWRFRMALTDLQIAEAKCVGLFDYPRHYAYLITTMSLCFLFGAMAPLLWVFSCWFLLIMYLVDRYNIRHMHCPSHTDYRLPRTGVNFLLFWCSFSMLVAALNYYVYGMRSAAVCMVLFVIFMLCFNLWRKSQFEVWILRGHHASLFQNEVSEMFSSPSATPLLSKMKSSRVGPSALARKRNSLMFSVRENEVEEQSVDGEGRPSFIKSI